jgi:bacterioferritin
MEYNIINYYKTTFKLKEIRMGKLGKHLLTAQDSQLLKEHPEIIELLQKAYNNEYLAWLAYQRGKHVIFGPWRENIINHFEEHAEEELDHSNYVADRLVALGEMPMLDMKALERANKDITSTKDWLEFTVLLEGEAVQLYGEILKLLENHPDMRNVFEGYVTTEQGHFEDFEKMLRNMPEIMAK